MMKKWMLLGLLLLVMSVMVHAEEEYRLREPDTRDYLQSVPEILKTWKDQFPLAYGKMYDHPVADVIQLELNKTYTSEQKFEYEFELLYSVYEALISAYDTLSYHSFEHYRPALGNTSWLVSLLEVWVSQNSVDLSQINTLNEIAGYTITIDQRDFNNDGINELQLDIKSGGYQGLIVLEKDATQLTGYRFIVELFWNSYSYTGEELYFADMTNDGLPERIFILKPNGGGIGNRNYCELVYITSWQSGQITQLNPRANHFCHFSEYQVENIDHDTEYEVIRTSQEYDNWGCVWTHINVLDWNGQSFISLEKQTKYDDTLGCALRQAEPLMWENQFAEAIPLYEKGLALGWKDVSSKISDYPREAEYYAQARLALAYALNEQPEKSQTILKKLSQEQGTSIAIDTMVSAMVEKQDPLSMCIAAFNVWHKYEKSTFFYRTLPIELVIGRLTYIDHMIENYPPEAAKAGCNAPELINRLLSNHQFSIELDPISQLEALGLEVNKVFVADFDKDGFTEYLVWLEAQVDPILFVTNREQYHLSRPDIRYPHEYTNFNVQETPDHEELLFIDYAVIDRIVSNVEYAMYDIDTWYCEEATIGDDRTSPGNIQIWRLEDNEFLRIIDTPVCKYQTFNELFSDDGRKLFAGAVTVHRIGPYNTDYYPGNTDYDNAVYLWDQTKRTYVPPPFEIISTLESSTDIQPYTDAYVFEILNNVFYMLMNDDAEESLAIVDDAQTNLDPRVQETVIYALHFYRALALEALNRPDEALAEYVAIYKAAPDSAWGMLAKLHFEVVGE